jgi:hypothetical protein
MASMNGSVARVWKSIRKHRWLAVAFAALCSIVMQPGTSTARRLGEVDVLAAATASAAWIGWKNGGLSIATASSFCSSSRR